MIVRTNRFKEEISKLGREIDFKIALYTNDKIITQNNEFLITENNLNLIVEQFDTEEIDELITNEDIYNVSIVRKGNLLSTMMKEVDFEIVQDLRIGDIVDCSFGLKVDNDYEYIDYWHKIAQNYYEDNYGLNKQQKQEIEKRYKFLKEAWNLDDNRK